MKFRKIIIIACTVLLVGILAYRIIAIVQESNRHVYNAARIAADNGIPVETVIAKNEKQQLKEPIYVRNGKAFVSASRIKKFKIGQKVSSGGFVISASRNIDLDTGLYKISTSSPDGEAFVLIDYNGVMLPLTTIHNDSVFVVENGIARAKPVKIIASDAENAIIDNILDGDKIITTKISEGQRIKQ